MEYVFCSHVKATLKSVEEEFEGDVKGIIPTDQPYPFIYDASMGMEISECEKLPRVGVLVKSRGVDHFLGMVFNYFPGILQQPVIVRYRASVHYRL